MNKCSLARYFYLLGLVLLTEILEVPVAYCNLPLTPR